MKTMKTYLLLLSVIIISISLQAQTTYFANSGSGNDANDGTSGSPYKTFHKAYTIASSGDIIDLTGTFDWNNIDEIGDTKGWGYTISKNITIQGQGPGSTFIQAYPSEGNGDRRVFSISNIIFTANDLTIRYGVSIRESYSEPTYHGGGIGSGTNTGSAYAGVQLFLDNVNITNNSLNSTLYYGGTTALYTEGSITATNCTFDNNKIDAGGRAHVIQLY